eukprot:ANDGO_05336.mRNA.1 Serine carboxypeptidase 24
MMRAVLFAVLIASVLSVGHGAPDPRDHLITSLPGLSQMPSFKMYAGHVPISATKNTFYWFVESQNDPATDPVVSWTSGGPGCSSIGAFLTEQGPFWPTDGGKTLQVNPYSWNRVANVIFIESPVGVGFSYSTNTSEYVIGDAQTAYDTWAFLEQFFIMFPQYRQNRFFASGESYAGHYVPQLAREILDQNAKVGADQQINLKGFLAGNPWTDAHYDNAGAVDMWFYNAIISEQIHDNMMKFCNFSVIGPLRKVQSDAFDGYASNDDCDVWTNQAMAMFNNINIYQILEDSCHSTMEAHTKQFMRARGISFKDEPASPCIDSWTQEYMNRQDVQHAIHATDSYVPWTDCSNLVQYSYKDLLTSVVPVYQSLLTSGIRMIIYSGSIDGIVPHPGTRAWINHELQPVVVEPWRPWISDSAEVGGFVVKFKNNLMFSTVRGAGHMVPGTQPERAFYLFSHFLADQSL